MTSAKEDGHPSYLERDRLALGATVVPATSAHVAQCDRCRLHLEQVQASPSVPDWVREMPARPTAEVLNPARRRWAWRIGVASIATSAAIMAIFIGKPLHNHVDEQSGYVGAKGTPVVWIYRKRGEDVALWDGNEPLASGDEIRLKVDPDGFDHVSVFAPTEAGRFIRLYQGKIKAQTPALLPVAWRLDREARSETLIVILAAKAIAPEDVEAMLGQVEYAQFWVTQLVLPKQRN
jgi:hypothetical protein